MLAAHGKDGGGGVALALLSLHLDRAADVLACTACLWFSAKILGGSVVPTLLGLICLAQFAPLGLLGLRRGQAADASACAASSWPRLKVGG